MILRNSLVSVAGSAVPLLVTVATLPFLLGAIGPERYGVLALCWLFMFYFGQADFGIGRATTYWVAKLHSEDAHAARSMMTSAVLAGAGAGLAMGTLGWLVATAFFTLSFDIPPAMRAELDSLPILIGAGIFATSLQQAIQGSLAGRERFVSIAFAQMLANASLPLLALLTALLIDVQMMALMLATLVGRVLGLAAAAFDLWRSQLREEIAPPQRAQVRSLLQFGIWIMLATITAPLLITLDRLVIGSSLGAAAVAAYTIPYQLVSRLQLLPQSLMNVIFPRMAIAEGDKAKEMAYFYVIAISACFLPIVIGLMLLMQPILELWLGNNLDPASVPVGMILLCGFLFTATSQTIVFYLQARDDGRYVGVVQIAEIVPYLALLLAAAEAFGLVGIAVVFTARRLIENLFFVARSGFGLARFGMTQLPALAGLAVAFALEGQLTGLWARLAAGAAIAGVAFAASCMVAPADLRRLVGTRLKARLAKARV